ncbi:MAG: hypothetical protein L6Q78_04975 [Bacteroidia bacterium]|nr:hypothetical protein [Bacteroidia bacterium]
MVYIKFNNQLTNTHAGTNQNSNLRKIIAKIFRLIFPAANPDFDPKINSVNTWLLEFNEEGIPVKEIGLNNNGKPIIKMPYKDNVGYWTDIGMHFNKFSERFQVEKINQVEFYKFWGNFDT